MANPLVYYRNTDFTSLEDPPNEPQLGTLEQEILDSAAIVEVDYINSDEENDDIKVAIFFTSEPSPADEAIIDGVIAAHAGVPATARYQGKKSNGESTNATTNWQDKISFTASPVKAGVYEIAVSCEIKLETGVQSMPFDRAVDAQVLVNGVQQGFTSWMVDRYHDFCEIGSLQLKEGDTPTVALQFRRVGASDTAYMRRARLGLKSMSMGAEDED